MEMPIDVPVFRLVELCRSPKRPHIARTAYCLLIGHAKLPNGAYLTLAGARFLTRGQLAE